MSGDLPTIEEVLARCDELATLDDLQLVADLKGHAAELLRLGEAILTAWHLAHGARPTDGEAEGFRLLALHRQAARGNPSFNACRETCREIVYHHNLVVAEAGSPETGRRLRLGAMVVRHLALFVGGKLEAAELGDFCCSSRALRQAEPENPRVSPDH